MLYIKCGCCGWAKHKSHLMGCLYRSCNKRQELGELKFHAKVVMKEDKTINETVGVF